MSSALAGALLGGTVPAEGSGPGAALAYLAVGAVVLFLLAPLAWLIGRDAGRHGRNAWLWGVLFVWQPVIVGLLWLIVRRRPPRGASQSPPGWYPDPSGAGALRWWDGQGWTAATAAISSPG